MINMFMLDDDLKQSARYTYDIHLRQQILELTQIISNVRTYYKLENIIKFRYIFRNNPICIWARSSLMNYLHIIKYCNVLQEELYYRGYLDLHKCIKLINSIQDNIHYLEKIFPVLEKQAYPQFMPPIFMSEDTIFSYRCYYFFFKRYKLPFGTTWKNREMPYWYNNEFFINNNKEFIVKLINSEVANYHRKKRIKKKTNY